VSHNYNKLPNELTGKDVAAMWDTELPPNQKTDDPKPAQKQTDTAKQMKKISKKIQISPYKNKDSNKSYTRQQWRSQTKNFGVAAIKIN
jgi:hypothetical protein